MLDLDHPPTAATDGKGFKCEGSPLAGRPFHCHPNAESSGEPDPRGGGHARRFCHERHLTMRHLTTSFPLLTIISMSSPRPPISSLCRSDPTHFLSEHTTPPKAATRTHSRKRPAGRAACARTCGPAAALSPRSRERDTRQAKMRDPWRPAGAARVRPSRSRVPQLPAEVIMEWLLLGVTCLTALNRQLREADLAQDGSGTQQRAKSRHGIPNSGLEPILCWR